MHTKKEVPRGLTWEVFTPFLGNQNGCLCETAKCTKWGIRGQCSCRTLTSLGSWRLWDSVTGTLDTGFSG